MSKDGTVRGGQRIGAGRKSGALADKIINGRMRNTTVLPEPTELLGYDMPPVREYMKEQQKDGKEFCAEDVFIEVYRWLEERKCEKLVNRQLIDQYAMSVARWVQCEKAISEYGFLAKHPTTGGAIASPYVSMSMQYLKQINQLWYQIYQVVKENCSVDYGGANPHDDLMERLLGGGLEMDKKTTTNMIMVPIEKLVPYVNNARTHSKEQITKLRSSLREFGFINPVIIDGDCGIIAGHGRVEAAKAEGFTEVPCVPVEHLTEAQKKAYILADNRFAEDAGWDEELLRIEIETLQAENFDIALTGFEAADIADLFDDRDAEAKEDEFNEDEVLEQPTFSKTGDVWHLGKHTVICEDSTDPEVFQRLLGDTKVNLVCTDSPYFVNVENSSGKIRNDDLNDEDAYKFLMKVFTNIHNAMAKDASFYEFYATAKSRIFHDAFEDAGFKVGAGLVWKKDRLVLTRTDWKYIHEPIIWGWRKDGKHVWYGDQKQTTVFEFPRIKKSKEDGFGHASSKPVPLIAYLVKQCTQTNSLVLDCFLGSASTLIACEQLGRVCFGIEIEPKFIDVAVLRFITLVGSDEDVYVERDGQKMSLGEVQETLEDKNAASEN